MGNVLNSVNVSVTLLGEGVRKSKLPGVRKAAELLDANRAELPKFFSEGGKGTMLPGYLATLATQLEAEQHGRLAEIEQLATNIAHIKEIVAMQQDYARVSGVIESWSPRSLIEEALRITTSDLEGGSVRVEIDCPADIPQVSADRHKVTQILINLFTNARQAMAQTPMEKRTLAVSAARQGAMVEVRVRDNGCGIPAENLTRIFNHGFTTKTDGHGFGLHSAANAAKETGGRLTGESDGPGLGATFRLELPVAEAAPVREAA